ncbi:NAD-dependent succinate-semialdehyde dehydrogenase [Jiangella alba]|uniref:Succinate semialdehyde dehydrogenase n=1 Tax=Jiangella alba TaxID=561176 RepID=A0A1H5Q0X7_9ACTN|nr:NAD-dependent succinate-semialdehyde dehydrogenase [Jiangella alba]SEF18887.1 succinate semialdehyde dehydrogenase [Jiangella alba]
MTDTSTAGPRVDDDVDRLIGARAGLFVGGAWIGRAASGRTFPVTDPATGRTLAELPDGGPAETRAAVEAAERARPGWAATTALERSALLRAVAQRLRADTERLARLITLEQGKPLAESRGEVLYSASFFDWFAEESRRVQGGVVPAPSRTKRILVTRRPTGIAAAITPWNFPAAAAARKLAAALAAGCPMIVKPSEVTPLTALALARIIEECGFPPGVVSVVTGADPAAVTAPLMDDFRVRVLSFTGSRPVGELLMRQAAATVKRVTMELGGHAPFIVFADADLSAAVDGALASKMRNMGQTCVCANRLYVHEDVADEFQEALRARLAAMRVGNGLDDGVEIGPLVDARAVAKAGAHVADAVAAGATVVLDGGPVPGTAGHFFRPVLLRGVDDTMLIAREETFGPVTPIMTFRTEDEVVARANATEFGLAAYCYTNDVGRAFRLVDRLEFGIIGLNDGIVSTTEGPFGGVKGSGFGREGGSAGIEEFLDPVYVSIGNVEAAAPPPHHPITQEDDRA